MSTLWAIVGVLFLLAMGVALWQVYRERGRRRRIAERLKPLVWRALPSNDPEHWHLHAAALSVIGERLEAGRYRDVHNLIAHWEAEWGTDE